MRHLFTTLVLLCIALPATAQPNRLAVVERVAAADAARFACAHTDRACAYDFIEALVCELRREDTRWGMNGRRGDPNRPSWDAINYCGAGPATDPTGACRERVTIIDVIAAAGSSAARPTWQAFTGDPTPGAWIVPDCGTQPAPTPNPTPTPNPPPAPTPAPVDLGPVLARLDAIAARVKALETAVGEATTVAAEARDRADSAAHDANIAARELLIVKDWIAQGLVVELSGGWLGSFRGRVYAPGGQ